MGAVHDPEKSCQDIVRFEPGASFRHGVGRDSDHLFVTIAPTTAGIARLARVEVTYTRSARPLAEKSAAYPELLNALAIHSADFAASSAIPATWPPARESSPTPR